MQNSWVSAQLPSQRKSAASASRGSSPAAARGPRSGPGHQLQRRAPPAPCSAPVQACCSWVEPPITCQEAAAAGMMLQSILRVTLEHLSAWSATPSMCHHELPGTPTGPRTLTGAIPHRDPQLHRLHGFLTTSTRRPYLPAPLAGL